MTLALRAQALEIVRAGLRAVAPETLLRRALRLEGDTLHLSGLETAHTVTLAPGGRLVLLAIGKAAAPLAAEAARLLGSRITQGLVVTKAGFGLPGLPFPQHECGHPVPDARGVAAADAAEAMLRGRAARDVVLVLISGGGSALLPAPVPGVSLADKQALAAAMLRADMDMHAINRERKALSRLKGGGLARLAAPARVVGLYLSDVPGDNLASIGSGPTVPQPDEPAQAAQLLRTKGLWEAAPAAVRAALTRSDESTAKRDDMGTPPPLNLLIGTNRNLLRAVAQAARDAGFDSTVDEQPLTGRVEQAAAALRARWAGLRGDKSSQGSRSAGRPHCLILGGEVTVEVRGQGRGGRCQELAARMLPHLDARSVFLALGSDGNDGPTDAAGGMVHAAAWHDIAARSIAYQALLADNDSYALLDAVGCLVRLPPTRNNLMDLYAFFGE